MQELNAMGVGPVLDASTMRRLLDGVSDRRGKIARMLASGELISLRRGLYASRRDLDPRCLAGPIYGPSYLSYETALEWHGLIPEAVREIVSATLRRGAAFENEFGRFRFFRIPEAVYPAGIQRVAESELPFLVASPTKALCDRIAREPGFRSVADVARWLEEMRIDPNIKLNRDELRFCAARYGRPAVRCLLRFAERKGTFDEPGT
jgi:hypothetical protein